MKLLSVGVPVYNVAPYLRQCVDSILAQTYREIEVILVDDGSTDASGGICDEFARQDARVHVIHQKNLGRMEARRTAVKHSSGEFMTFVDSDDFIRPEMYQKLMELQAEYDCDIVTSGIFHYGAADDVALDHDQVDIGFYDESAIAAKIIPNMIWKDDSFGIDPSLCNKIFKKECLTQEYKRSKNIKISYGEDILICYPMMVGAHSMYISYDAYYYHRKKYNENTYERRDNYLEELYRLYAYLKSIFRQTIFWTVLEKQLDLMYIASVDRRRRIYGQYSTSMRYLFPFDKVRRDADVILYGAGIVGRTFSEQIKKAKYCNLVRWVDQRFEQYKAAGLPVDDIDQIASTDYDVIVIAVASLDVQEQICRKLEEEYSIDSKKIVKTGLFKA